MEASSPQPRVGSWLAERALFLGKFLRHGTRIASAVPSSRWMARAMLEGIDFDRAKTIVELGAGTGAVTKHLLARVHDACRVLIVERDPDLAEFLRERFPGADIAACDARDLERLLKDRRIARIDHVISGLPTPCLPEEVRRRLMMTIAEHLAEDGTVRQLTEFPWSRYRALYQRYFNAVRFRRVLMNIPPGGYYCCAKPKSAA